MIPSSLISVSSSSRTDVMSRVADGPSRTQATTPSRAGDRVELSSEARKAASDERPVRLDLVQRIREQIASGTYETDDKIVVAAAELARRGFDPRI